MDRHFEVIMTDQEYEDFENEHEQDNRNISNFMDQWKIINYFIEEVKMEIDVYEVVKKIIGSIKPTGRASEDEKRYENLKELTSLADAVLEDICIIERTCKKDRNSTVKRACKHCSDFLDSNNIGKIK